MEREERNVVDDVAFLLQKDCVSLLGLTFCLLVFCFFEGGGVGTNTSWRGEKGCILRSTRFGVSSNIT